MKKDHLRLDLGDRPEEKSTPSGWEYLSDGGRIRCVFSSGGKLSGTVLWFVEQIGPERFEARRINPKNVPSGDPEIIPMHQLVNEYTPQLALFEEEVMPAMTALEETLDQGDALRDEGRLYSAEMEYGSALEIDEENVRALFGLGLIFAGRKELDRTRELLSELIDMRSPFMGKNQHLFNEFGIALRKIGLFGEAVEYYSRALEFVHDDENLLYNLARSHYENGDWTQCMEALSRSQQLNSGLEVGRDLVQLIVGLAEKENLLSRYNKPPVPPEVAEQARRMLSSETHTVSLDEVSAPESEIGRARYGGNAEEAPPVNDLDLLGLEDVDE